MFYLCKLKVKRAFCPYFRLKWKQKTEFASLWRTNTWPNKCSQISSNSPLLPLAVFSMDVHVLPLTSLIPSKRLPPWRLWSRYIGGPNSGSGTDDQFRLPCSYCFPNAAKFSFNDALFAECKKYTPWNCSRRNQNSWQNASKSYWNPRLLRRSDLRDVCSGQKITLS